MVARNTCKRSSDEFEIIKNDFIEALGRLINKIPCNSRNLQRLRKGKLEITLSSVADEAERSRSLIARSGTKYHEVRNMILNHGKRKVLLRGGGVRKLEKAKLENLDLRKRLELSLEAQAQMLFEKTRVERDSARWLKAYRALQEQVKRGGNVVSVVFDK